MNIEEDNIYDAIVTAGDNLGHVHIGETNRRAPGAGKFDWESLSRGLRKINYQGSVVMEPFLIPGGEVGRDIKIYRNLSEGIDMDKEAARALNFMRSVLTENN
jgi:D-psicose/D-tagatose/L-ribulose 3-epimerase